MINDSNPCHQGAYRAAGESGELCILVDTLLRPAESVMRRKGERYTASIYLSQPHLLSLALSSSRPPRDLSIHSSSTFPIFKAQLLLPYLQPTLIYTSYTQNFKS